MQLRKLIDLRTSLIFIALDLEVRPLQVSQVLEKYLVVSVPEQSENAGSIDIEGGQVINHSAFEASEKGTSIYVRDLFYNTPARLKFIKSKTSERNQLRKTLYSFILSNPEIEFSVKWDKKEKEVFKSVNKTHALERVKDVFQKHLKKGQSVSDLKICNFEHEYEGYKIQGYFSENSVQSNSKAHYLFINNRLILDPALHRSVTYSAQKIWPLGQAGYYCLFLTVPVKEIDVNVHPNKTQVKFEKPNIIYSLISAMSRSVERIETPRSQTDHGMTINKMTQDSGSIKVTPHFELDQNNNLKQGQSQQQSTTSLENGYYLTQQNENHYVVFDCSQFIATQVNLLYAQLPIPESEITPLLITEPLPFVSTPQTWLKDFGFEIEFLHKSAVLRTIPKLFEKIDYTFFLRSFFENSKSHSLKTDFQKFIFSRDSYKAMDFTYFWALFNSPLTDFEESDYIRSLDKKALESLFTRKGLK